MTTRTMRLVTGFVALGALGAGLVLLEGAARLLAPHAMDGVVPGRIFAIDAQVGWRLQPNREVRHQTRYFDVTYRTSSRGYRDVEHTSEKPADVRRVLFFGDSRLFGWGIPLGERFADIVARGTPAELWNFGVPAYGLDQMVIL